MERLVEQALSGDQDAFGRLVKEHWHRLVAIARSIVGVGTAEDMVQDGFLAAWNARRSMRNPAGFRTWITRIVVRECFRHAKKQRMLTSLDSLTPASETPAPDLPLDVETVLKLLPPRQRAVLHLTAVEELSDTEIGAILRIRTGSVRAHRRRARDRIVRELKKGSDP